MVDERSTTLLLRVRVADRPGALGAVTSRIGAIRGDVVSIDVLERAPGWAIDELVVSIPDPELIDLMLREIDTVDGVDVEHVEPVGGTPFDPQLHAYEVAAIIAGCDDVDDLFEALCEHGRRAIRTAGLAVVDPAVDEPLAMSGTVKNDGHHSVWMPLPTAGVSLVLSRPELPFRARERRQAAALARIADSLYARIREQRRLRSLVCHPSSGLPARHVER